MFLTQHGCWLSDNLSNYIFGLGLQPKFASTYDFLRILGIMLSVKLRKRHNGKCRSMVLLFCACFFKYNVCWKFLLKNAKKCIHLFIYLCIFRFTIMFKGLGSVRFFSKELIFVISNNVLNWFKVKVKTHFVQKFRIQINTLLFNLIFIKES